MPGKKFEFSLSGILAILVPLFLAGLMAIYASGQFIGSTSTEIDEVKTSVEDKLSKQDDKLDEISKKQDNMAEIDAQQAIEIALIKQNQKIITQNQGAQHLLLEKLNDRITEQMARNDERDEKLLQKLSRIVDDKDN